jgi:hypothetical protein
MLAFRASIRGRANTGLSRLPNSGMSKGALAMATGGLGDDRFFPSTGKFDVHASRRSHASRHAAASGQKLHLCNF